MMKKLRGKLKRIIFHNPESGYSVLAVDNSVSGGEDVVVGHFGPLAEGQEVEFDGEWVHNPRYARNGPQFKADSYRIIPPSSRNAIISFLCEAISGVGQKTATVLVEKFGENTLEVIEHHPEQLTSVPGIGTKTAQSIADQYRETFESRDLMLFLAKHDIATHWAFKIFRAIGAGALEKVRENPFLLMKTVRGIGFRKADKIFFKLGGDQADPRRLRAGLLFTLRQALDDGDLYLEREEWLSKASGGKVLSIPVQTLEKFLQSGESGMDEEVVEEEGKVYLRPVYHLECLAAEMLARLYKMGRPRREKISEDLILSSGVPLDEEQRRAVITAWAERVFILTGGPGTGKTTILKSLVHIALKRGLQVQLASPTGRAAKRMRETTGFNAQTLHKLLEYDGERFGRDPDNRLEGDIFIIDEASMVDLNLFYHFLLAFPEKSGSLVLVGDPHQLPPVGAGNVLNELIKSDVFPKVYLDRIYRQEADSHIIENAHRVLKGEMPYLKNRSSSDFFFIEESDPVKVEELVIDLCTTRLPKFQSLDPLRDIQVLSPVYRGVGGVTRLNQLLQERLNKGKTAKPVMSTGFRIGDKVMQIVNDYQKNVTNGEIGMVLTAGNNIDQLKNNAPGVEEKAKVIDFCQRLDHDDRESLDSSFSFWVDFDGNIAVYSLTELDMLTLAYCCTVHKSQGSEYSAVVIPLLNQHYIMLKRNLLYTAITRSRKLCVLVGSRSAVELAVREESVPRQNSLLGARARTSIGKVV